MALAEIYIRRDCPSDSFAYVEEVVIPCVGEVVYGTDFENAAVTARASHATLKDTFMELGVKIDTEDLPQPGWLVAHSGLCVPKESSLGKGGIKQVVSIEGLTERQLYGHHLVQAQLIVKAIAAHDCLWSERIGWDGSLGDEGKVGVLVETSHGAWVSTASKHEH